MPSEDIIDACLIGVNKAGTTSLANWLSSHPQVSFSNIKEPYYYWQEASTFSGPQDLQWTHLIVQDKADYLELFASDQTAAALKMEATPYYANLIAIERLYTDNNNVKLILVLRDPVERSLSSYRHLKREGFESLPFAKALEQEEWRVQSNWGPLYRYRLLSDYVLHIRNLLSIVPRDQILFVLYEHMRDNQPDVLRLIQDFLSIEYHDVPLARMNVGYQERSQILSKFVYSSLGRAQDIGRILLPSSIRCRMGSRALEFADRVSKQDVQVDWLETKALWNFYEDQKQISELTGLDCGQYWKCLTDL